MKLIFKNIVLGLLTLFVLFASFGFSFSKISCPMGERYVLGSEMPSERKMVKNCCIIKSGIIPKKDNRKKTTFCFQFDFETNLQKIVELSRVNTIVVNSLTLKLTEITLCTVIKKQEYKIEPPPLIKRPTLEILQSYLI